MILQNPCPWEGEIHSYEERRSIMMTDWYDKTMQALQLNGKGERTQEAYAHSVRMLIQFYGKPPGSYSPFDLG